MKCYTGNSGTLSVPISPATFEEMIDRAWVTARTILIERQRKYGPYNIGSTGLPGISVRLHDKTTRLVNATIFSNGREVKDETILDTLIDVANYGIIGLTVQAGHWTRAGCPPLKEETEREKRPHFTAEEIKAEYKKQIGEDYK